jgi:hypothetical protein
MQNIFIGIRDNSFLDIMSLTHILSGLGLGLIFMMFKKTSHQKIYFKLGFILLIVWELFEFGLRFLRVYYPLFLEKLLKTLKFIPSGWTANESALNIFSDLIIGFLGLLIIYLIFKQHKLRKSKNSL